MRRVLGDTLVSAAALSILMIALVSIDGRVREQVTRAIQSVRPSGIAGVATEVRDVASVLLTAARDRSVEHAPLMIFIAAATVLVVCMLRT